MPTPPFNGKKQRRRAAAPAAGAGVVAHGVVAASDPTTSGVSSVVYDASAAAVGDILYVCLATNDFSATADTFNGTTWDAMVQDGSLDGDGMRGIFSFTRVLTANNKANPTFRLNNDCDGKPILWFILHGASSITRQWKNTPGPTSIAFDGMTTGLGTIAVFVDSHATGSGPVTAASGTWTFLEQSIPIDSAYWHMTLAVNFVDYANASLTFNGFSPGDVVGGSLIVANA